MNEIRLIDGTLVIAGERETPEPQARIRVLDARYCATCESVYDGTANRCLCAGCGRDGPPLIQMKALLTQYDGHCDSREGPA